MSVNSIKYSTIAPAVEPSTTYGRIDLTNLPFLQKGLGAEEKSVIKNLEGQVVIITGSNTGIGKATAVVLAKTGATIILACRDHTKALPVVDEIKTLSGNSNIRFMQLDLGDLTSVKEFAEEFHKKYQRLDILVNNAGVGNLLDRKTTKDGFEMQFGVNHLGHFYLTNLVLDLLRDTPKSRVINVSSDFHRNVKMDFDNLQFERNYEMVDAYSHSKLYNILFTRELARRVKDDGIKVVSLSPGVVNTDINRNLKEKWYSRIFLGVLRPIFWLMVPSPERGAQTSLYLSLEEHEKLIDGGYYSDCHKAVESEDANNEEYQRKLWQVSEELIKNANV